MDQRKRKRTSTLFHSTKNGLQNIIVLKKIRKGERFAFCTTCANNFGRGYGGENDIKRQLETPKHKSNVTSLK